jgi:hypothetical protein
MKQRPIDRARPGWASYLWLPFVALVGLEGRTGFPPAEQLTFLLTAYGKPMSAVGFSNWFVDARAAQDCLGGSG